MENIEIEDLGKCKKRFKCSIPSSKVAPEIERILKDLILNADISGFRKGKVPKNIIINKYKNTINREVINNLIPASAESIARENKIDIIFPIIIENAEISSDNILEYRVIAEYIPEFELKNYMNINLTKKKNQVKEEEVQELIKRLQHRVSELIVVEDGKKPADGDHVFLDIEMDDKKNKKSSKQIERNIEFVIGSGDLSTQIENHVKEMIKGEEKDIDLKLPAENSGEKIEEESVKYKIVLKEIKKEILPELNDDFAKDVGNFKTLDELNLKIREDIIKNKELTEKKDFRNQIKNILLTDNIFDVPESMINKEKSALLENVENMFKRSGRKFNDATTDEKNKIEYDIAENAMKNVKLFIIFEKIAEKEKDNIKVDNEDLNNKIETWAKNYYSKNEIDKLKTNNDIRANFLSQILTEKIYDFLTNHAIITDVV
ncbi:trigger factor [Candidatus Desantisbacteria bacterium]|nr:trigger factor [Candidatus Desantisbacteria bacterium]